MTIKRIADYLRDHNIPYCGQDLNDKDDIEPFYLSELKGKRVVIETAGIICKQNYGAIQQALKTFPFQWIDDLGWTQPDTSEVYEIFKRYFKSYMRKVKESGIIPIAIIEGKSPKLKAQTTAKRVEIKDNNKVTAELNRKCRDLQLFKKSVAASYLPGATHVQLAMDALKELGIITLRGYHEGEGVCAQLVMDEDDPYHCSCAITDDYDIFMYGCPSVLRNLRTDTKERGVFHGTGYALVDILKCLGFLDPKHTKCREKIEEASKRFQLLCILSGTDYHSNVKGLGPAKIQKIMLQHNIQTYEEICNIEEKFYEIPYHSILRTLEKNKKYNLVFDPAKTTEEVEQFNKARSPVSPNPEQKPPISPKKDLESLEKKVPILLTPNGFEPFTLKIPDSIIQENSPEIVVNSE